MFCCNRRRWIVDHPPYSYEIDGYGSTKGLLESSRNLEPGIVRALVEIVSERDLLDVVFRQQPDLIAEREQS